MGELRNPQLRIGHLKDISDLKDFECGIKSMDTFIQNGLADSIKNHYCEPYICRDDANNIIAFFALSFDSVVLDSDDKEDLSYGISTHFIPEVSIEYQDTFWSKRRYPAIDIAYLAVSKNHRGKGIGRVLIDEICNSARNQNYAGCQFICVDALSLPDYEAISFYSKCGFAQNECPNPGSDTIRMFLPLYAKEIIDEE